MYVFATWTDAPVAPVPKKGDLTICDNWRCNSLLDVAVDYMYILSLHMVVLNSRDWPENIWLPKRMHIDKQCYKNQNTKNRFYFAKSSLKFIKCRRSIKIIPNLQWINTHPPTSSHCSWNRKKVFMFIQHSRGSHFSQLVRPLEQAFWLLILSNGKWIF